MNQSLPSLASLLAEYRSEMVELVGAIPLDQVAELAELIVSVTLAGGMIYTFGNGGSAATASHIGCDLLKNTRVEGAPPGALHRPWREPLGRHRLCQ